MPMDWHGWCRYWMDGVGSLSHQYSQAIQGLRRTNQHSIILVHSRNSFVFQIKCQLVRHFCLLSRLYLISYIILLYIYAFVPTYQGFVRMHNIFYNSFLKCFNTIYDLKTYRIDKDNFWSMYTCSRTKGLPWFALKPHNRLLDQVTGLVVLAPNSSRQVSCLQYNSLQYQYRCTIRKLWPYASEK